MHLEICTYRFLFFLVRQRLFILLIVGLRHALVEAFKYWVNIEYGKKKSQYRAVLRNKDQNFEEYDFFVLSKKSLRVMSKKLGKLCMNASNVVFSRGIA